MACSGNCKSCGGCIKQLLLTQGEIDLLNTLGQYSFLPVARRADSMTPVYLEEGANAQSSLILQALEQKGLVDIDYAKPLAGADMSAYAGFPVHGSLGLTALGQTVVDLIEKQGID